jgi:hypothetical protein
VPETSCLKAGKNRIIGIVTKLSSSKNALYLIQIDSFARMVKKNNLEIVYSSQVLKVPKDEVDAET